MVSLSIRTCDTASCICTCAGHARAVAALHADFHGNRQARDLGCIGSEYRATALLTRFLLLCE